ncbi:MAG TPA: pyridoxal phosphate-dependent aminotransferase [Nitrospira sp.]|nr:pyridoxal phosphate-dependent aminotransferase [Nitrospira sp.]
MFRVMDHAQTLERQGHSIYHLELGNPQLIPPAVILEATAHALRPKHLGYAPMAGLRELRAGVASRYTSLTGEALTETQVVISPANLLIHQFFDITCDPGDHVVCFTPAFPSYFASAAHLGLHVNGVRLVEEEGFRLTPDSIKAALALQPRAIILNNANNPTGAFYDPAIVRELADRCEAAGIWLLSDETYADLVFDGQFTTLASTQMRQVVVISSFSKVLSIPGFRTGYALAHEAVAAKLALSNSTLYSCLPAFTQLGCLAGLAVLDEYAASIRARSAQLLRTCADRINRSRVLRCHVPESGFYLFIDIGRTTLDDMTFCRRLLEEHHTAVTPGRSFGSAYSSYIRLAACGQEEAVVEGVTRTIAFAQSLGGSSVQAA